MWGDQQQLQITANCYNVKINVLTVNQKGEGTVLKESFIPDPRLSDYANLPADKTEMRELWLMYSNGNHYDALVSKEHPLLTLGIISDMEKDEQFVKDVIEDGVNNSKDKDKLIADLTKRLKQSEQSTKNIETMYREAEKQIKTVKEENQRLRINVNDLNEYIKEKDNEDTTTLANKEQTKKVCKFIWKEKDKIDKITEHSVRSESSEEMYNCIQCSFQSTISAALSKHMNLKHRTPQEQSSDVFKCTDCNSQFSEKWNMMNHRIQNHEITEVCKYFLQRNCNFNPPKKCWLLHQKPKDAPKERDQIECYVCKQTFRTRNGMMRHRKQYHEEVVPECRENLKGTCEFTGEDKVCWFKHSDKNQDFQNVQENLAPPSKR